MSKTRLTAFVLAVGVLYVPVTVAQTVTGSILGTVRDSTGSTVPGAAVAVVNEGTNSELKTVTNSSGDFVAPALPAGSYSVRVEAAGFRPTLVTNLTLLPNRSLRQDFALEVGAVQQTVEVAATAPVVNSESSTIGNVMQSDQITTLPLNGRMLDRLIRISAGVTTDSASVSRDHPIGVASSLTSTGRPSMIRETAAGRTPTGTEWQHCRLWTP